MNKELRLGRKNYNIVLLLGSVLILVVYLYKINQMNILYILGDEYGYWADASYFWGYDWSGVTSNNLYYSFGYSLILIPLFLIKNAALRYQIAIFINVLMQILCFLMLIDIFKKIFTNISEGIIILACLAGVMYSSNVFQAKTTLAETMLCFCFVAIVFFLTNYLQTERIIYEILLVLLSIFIFCVHMRSIGITVCVIAFFIFDCIQKRRIHIRIIFWLLLFIVGIFIALAVKDNIISKLYLNSSTTSSNDISSNVQKAASVLSLNGLILLIKSLLGKFYYLFAASFLLIFWALFKIVKDGISGVKEIIKGEEKQLENVLAVFLCLCFLATILISAIFMMEPSATLDRLIYGRYNDFIMEPLLVIGILTLIQNKNNLKLHLSAIVIFLILTMFVSYEFSLVENPTIRTANIPGISMLAYNGTSFTYRGWEIVVAFKALCIFMIAILILNLDHTFLKIQTVLPIILFMGIWIMLGNGQANYQLYLRERYNTNADIVNYLDENNINDITYLTLDEFKSIDLHYPDILQFMSPDLSVNYENINLTDVSALKAVLYRKDYSIPDFIFEEFNIAIDSDTFYLFIHK